MSAFAMCLLSRVDGAWWGAGQGPSGGSGEETLLGQSIEMLGTGRELL